MGILVYSPLGGGFLTGKYQRGQPRPKGTRLDDPMITLPFDDGKGFDIVEQLDRIGKEHNATVAQAALNYLLRKPGITSVIIGARAGEQLTDNLRTTDWEMATEEVARLDELTQPTPIYPYRFLAQNPHGR